MDGFEATRRIRAWERPGGDALVIVALTADSLATTASAAWTPA